MKTRKVKRDVKAIQWAISLLEIHEGVMANENSQYWLNRLRALVPDTPARTTLARTTLSVAETRRLLGAAYSFPANFAESLDHFLRRHSKIKP